MTVLELEQLSHAATLEPPHNLEALLELTAQPRFCLSLRGKLRMHEITREIPAARGHPEVHEAPRKRTSDWLICAAD